LHREKKRKKGKEVVASTSTDSPVKNTRSKRVNVAKKTKSKKRLLADLM
jgi:hypothetical protein